jgi:hypothetical protein
MAVLPAGNGAGGPTKKCWRTAVRLYTNAIAAESMRRHEKLRTPYRFPLCLPILISSS